MSTSKWNDVRIHTLSDGRNNIILKIGFNNKIISMDTTLIQYNLFYTHIGFICDNGWDGKRNYNEQVYRKN